jgi:hypothetical protein
MLLKVTAAKLHSLKKAIKVNISTTTGNKHLFPGPG